MNFADKLVFLLENASSGIFILDSNERFTSVNHTFNQFLGYSKEELAGKSIKEVVYPQEGSESSSEVDQAEKLIKMQGEKPFIRKDGQIVWGELTIHLLQEVGKPLTYQIGVITNITGKKAEESQLFLQKRRLAEQEQSFLQREEYSQELNLFSKAVVQQPIDVHAVPSIAEGKTANLCTLDNIHPIYSIKNSEEEQWMNKAAEQDVQFQAQLLELIDSAIISLTHDLYIRTWSMGAESLFGIPAAEAIGLRLSEVLLIKDYEHFLEGIIKEKEILVTAWKGEAIVIARRQSACPVYFTFVPMEGARGRDEGYLLVCKDIEEVSSIQHKLIEQQAYIVSVTENLADSIFALNENFELLYLNTAFKTTSKRYLGLEVKAGDSIYAIASEKGKKQLVQNWQKVQKGERVSYEYEFISVEGNHYFYDVYTNPIFGIKNEVTGIFYIYRDITDKKQMEAALQRMQAEILNAQLHEQIIQTAALMEGQELERKRLARELHDGLGQMLNVLKMQLVRDASMEARQTVDLIMAEIIRLNNALMPLVLQDFGLQAGIRQLVEQYKKLTKAKFYYYSDVNQERFDPKFEISVYRIVQEAVSNAVKHAKANTISIQLILNTHSLLIMIEDDGVGFDAGKQKAKPGKGYGLLNMQFRVEAVGGKMVIETGSGQGCVLTIELPLDY